MKHTIQVFMAGCVVYGVMAACSAGAGAPGGAGGSGGSTVLGGEGGAPDDPSSSGGPVPNAMADEWYVAGSRLKLRYYQGEDGSKQFVGWTDSARGESCGYGRHADGSIRCLPDAVQVGSFYADAGCSVKLGVRPKTSEAPAAKYAVVYENGGSRLYAITAAHSGPSYVGQPGGCYDGTSGAATLDVYNLGAEVASSSFVGAAEKTAP